MVTRALAGRTQVPPRSRVPAAMTRRLTTLAALAGALALPGALAPAAPAIVPPKDCGFVKVSGKRYNIKADQMTCKVAVKYSVAYLKSTKNKPKGYTCKRYGSETALKFNCYRGSKRFFAIKR